MTKWIASIALLIALLAPTSAFASFVCETAYFPGSNARLRTTITSGASCTGATQTLWFCEPTNTSSSCAIAFARYSVPELLGLYDQLGRAADSQQSVVPGLTTCTGTGSVTCGYYVSFGQ